MRSLLLCLLIFPGAIGFASSKIRYPYVEQVVGRAFLLEENVKVENRKSVVTEKEQSLKHKVSLKDRANLVVKGDSKLVLNFSAESQLIIYQNSVVDIPHINWETGMVAEVRLVSGSLRWICKQKCGLLVHTPITKNEFSVGDFLLEYDDSSGKASLTVIDGQSSFSGLDNEVSATLRAGEKTSFQGILENKEPAFDLLLHGRKIAKGRLNDTEKVDLTPWQKELKAKPKPVKVVSKKQEAGTGKQICANPVAEFQQCSWVCDIPRGMKPKASKNKISECDLSAGAKCIRKRCDANGQWSDAVELSSQDNKCGAKPLVDSCDY